MLPIGLAKKSCCLGTPKIRNLISNIERGGGGSRAVFSATIVQASGKNLKDTKGNDCHAKKCEYKEEMENRYPMRSSSLSPQDDANLPDDDCSGLAQASNPGDVPHRMAQRNETRNETRMIPSGALTKPEKEGTKPGTKPKCEYEVL